MFYYKSSFALFLLILTSQEPKAIKAGGFQKTAMKKKKTEKPQFIFLIKQ
jgi:hypothetical protein